MNENEQQQQNGGQQDGANGAQSAQQQNEQQNEQQQQQPAPLTFERWIAEQPEDVRDLIDGQLDRIKAALDSERTARTGLEKQIKAISKQAGEGSELRTQLDKLAGDMQATGARATFYEAAHDAGVKNLKLAWVAAKEFDLVKDDGKTDFNQLKTLAPELFATATPTPKAPPANAGAGAGQAGARNPNMNNFLRAAAGRG